MRTWTALVLVSCLMVACDEDPARKVKIIPRPPSPVLAIPGVSEAAAVAADKSTPTKEKDGSQTASSTEAKASGAMAALRTPEWRPVGCPPPPENLPGSSTLKVSGPCSFEHRGTFACEAIHDDFIISASRKAAGGASLMIYINVERYKGPGSYEGAEMFVGVQDATSIHRWSSDQVSITVGAAEAFAILPRTHLEAEPLLVDCSGPQTNYQCGGRSDTAPINGTVEIIAGTLRCGSTAKTK